MGKALHSFFVHLCVKMSACQGNLTKCWGLNISFRGELQLVFSLSTTSSVAYFYRISVSFTHERKSIDLRDSFYSQDWHNHALFLFKQKRHVSAEEESKNQLITIQFSWKGDVKPIGSSFIGTSPEFEMALYTVCYLAGEGEDVQVEIDDYDVTVKAHHMGPYMGSCYPQCWQYWHLYYLVIMNLINLK